METTYQITEYGSFVSGKEVAGYTALPESTFNQLENFILSNRSKDTDALELMGLSAKKGVGKVITAKNYVGIITMNDGTSIEILPKIYSEESQTETKIKKLVVDMLKTLRNSPYKALQTSNVNIEKMNIFEIFIRMFIEEVFVIVKRGLKCNYETIQENEKFFKGKILFAEQLKYNYAHKERCYMEHDEFNSNRPENKLLKATLSYLYRQSSSMKNKNDLKILLDSFREVETSVDYEGDFAKYVPDRNMKDYTAALLWSGVFLMGKSFTSFSGSEVAVALLFPMETLFESYVAAKLKKVLGMVDYKVSVQDKSYHLFDLPNKKFLMKPDIVVRRKADNAEFVLDTKWKILSDSKPNYGISQADMYQMYVYHKKYNARNVTLIYPRTDKLSEDKSIEFKSDDGVNVKVRFVDLFDVESELNSIVRDLEL